MAKYSIEDTTLTNIAEAIRNKSPKDAIIHEVELETKVSKTANAIDFDSFEGAYDNGLQITDTVTIEGASFLKVKVAYQTENTQYDYLQITPGNGTAGSKLGGSGSNQPVEYVYKGTDTVSFYFKSDSSNGNYLGYYAEITGYKEEEEILSQRSYTPLEMPAAIEGLTEPPSRKLGYYGTGTSTNPQLKSTYSDTSTFGSWYFYPNLSTNTSGVANYVWYKKTKNDVWPVFYSSNMTDGKKYKIMFYIWCSEGKTVEWANNNVYLNSNCQTTHNLNPVTDKPQLFEWEFQYTKSSSSYEPTLHIYPNFNNADADTYLMMTPVLLFRTDYTTTGTGTGYSSHISAY